MLVYFFHYQFFRIVPWFGHIIVTSAGSLVGTVL